MTEADAEQRRDTDAAAVDGDPSGWRSLPRRIGPDTAAMAIGGAGLLGGLRAIRRGDRVRGLLGVAVGAALLRAGIARRRARSRLDESSSDSVDETDADAVEVDVAETGRVSGTDDADEAGTDAVAAVAEVPPEVDERADAATADPVVALADADQLGAAAFDARSHEVPVPQRAFNQGFLAHSAEAFWGVDDGDGAVVVSKDYDAVEGRDGVHYVASTEIGADVRELPIPDTVLDHWDAVYGGGTAVGGGDDILFVTTDDLTDAGLLRVLPAAWAEDTTA
ncbi:hypothetical protein [Halobaculum marinum]|uniref:Uncharacterized protein n=1 Tax=Halobaculum marinum TaxID=3031996 RepID=A0ABD5WYS2_9EURY|nr:hypothetical protein [Halobaculum sp. DT55]